MTTPFDGPYIHTFGTQLVRKGNENPFTGPYPNDPMYRRSHTN